jgi:PKD repeat protein
VTSLRVKEDIPTATTYRSYLKFDVPNAGATVGSVRLRLYVTDPTPNSIGVYAIANTTWIESAINFNNAPAIAGSPLVSSSAPIANAYVDINLPASSVTPGSLVTFGLKSTGTNSLIFNSREAGSNLPQLIVTFTTPPPPPQPPVGAFSAAPTSGDAPLTVAFTDQSTNNPTAWAWDFGDPGSGSNNTSTLKNPTHTFSSPGTYTVTLTPSNGAGPGTPESHQIQVTTPSGNDPVLVGAGDVAYCTRTQDEATANLLDGIPGTVFAAGDLSYPTATLSEFQNCYGPSWGRHKARTKPAIGNHEYDDPGAAGYFGYWGSAAGPNPGGYYSFDIGTWHVVVLNANCSDAGGCNAGSPQYNWLQSDLVAHPSACTAAIWHQPRFSSSGGSGAMLQIWQLLYDSGAEIVLNGHRHNYERFAPQTAAGAADPAFGIREFVVGTGGASLSSFSTIAANSEVRSNTTYGVLKLTLHSTSYDYSFLPIAGQTFTDSGVGSCHGTPSQSAQAAAQTATKQALQDWTVQQAARDRHRPQ